MTAFDTAWRKGKEDATARTLQEAYDQGDDDFNRFQRWFHVAEPIEVFMPNNDKPQQMERTHIGTNRLADEKGEYVGAEQAMADYQEDLQNLSRKRKNPKDPKYARIFIPNPESKIDDIGDFHIDEAHSDDWQEKLAGEPMTAFDTAWDLMKSIDDDSNDDEFIDNSQFDNPVAAKIDEIMEIFGGSSPLECYSCGLTGPTSTFVGWHGERVRKCPECKSYEIHKYDPSIPVNPEWIEAPKKKDKQP